jgi:HTH-type transcriptional repressor of NAD biosynthesis genes
MIKAFVFGKFCPFHKGHEAMIRFALTKCDFLTVLVCCSDKEDIPCAVRRTWIEKTFAQQKNIEVKTFDYLESELPNTSVSSRIVSEAWAKAFGNLFPDYSELITSEEYGNYVAECMNIRHIAFDVDRKLFAVSASVIRKDLFRNWQFLPDSVKPYFVRKVVVLGSESTGKTVLTNNLAKYFNATLVSEAGRDIIADSNSFTVDDLHLVAKEHAKRIEQSVLGSSPLVIIDTDIHITKSYSRFAFGRELEVPAEVYEASKADLYLYLNTDVAYFQDGTRLSEEERNLLDLSHRQALADHDISFVEITGNWEQRFEKAKEYINKLIDLE